MASGGLTTAESEAQRRVLLRALKGVKQGTWIILATLLVAFVVILLTAIHDDFAVLFFFPVLALLFAIARIFYAVFFQSRGVREPETSQVHIVSAPRALSPPMPNPVESFRASPKQTAEVVEPPSVTESTTRLLDDA